MKAGFLEKLLERITRVGPEEMQTYLLQLAREKGFLEAVFEAIREGVIVTDPRGRIVYLNRAACGLFGLDPEEAIGARLGERVRGLDWSGLARGDEVVSRDMEIFYPDNRLVNFYMVPLRETGAAVRRHPDQAEEVTGYVLLLRDMTEARRSTEAAIESERLSALTLLAAGVAHEIGNPLNSLQIHLQLMERTARKVSGKPGEDLMESVRVAREEIGRLDQIVTQFLRAIRPTPLERHPADLNRLVEESVSFLSKEIRNRDILVEQELRRDLPLVEVDRDQIKQAFYNVIRNSFQAMKTGGILRIRTEADAEYALVEFRDTGGGIPADQMGQLFQPYFTTKEKGSGLGLLVVRRIVREHGGEIALRSDEGRGLTVAIRIPLHERRVALLGSGERPVAGDEGPGEGSEFGGARGV